MSDQDIGHIIKPNCDTCMNGALSSPSSPCQDCGSEGDETPEPKREPSAFPRVVSDPYRWSHEQGMTLRDYFAAKAMAALVETELTNDALADTAYKLADAMMDAREQKEEE